MDKKINNNIVDQHRRNSDHRTRASDFGVAAAHGPPHPPTLVTPGEPGALLDLLDMLIAIAGNRQWPR
jgi:hypothetical protein